MDSTVVLSGAVLAMCLAPAAFFVLIALASLSGRRLSEALIGWGARAAMAAAAIAATTMAVTFALGAEASTLIPFGDWFTFGGGRFEFVFVVDRFSVGFALLSVYACGVVGAFSFRYLHREAGYQRYFAQLSLFTLGLTLVALAGSAEVLFAGWELLGLSSALLIGFFHERRAPVRNALRVFAVYRISDAAMLSAAVLLHHWAHSGSLTALFSADGGALSDHQLLVITLLILVAVAGKSALVPFSGWLPRAMEGPTPSSAVYYGALSIHAGCYLLLRAEPLLAQSTVARILAVGAGAATALYTAVVGRAQADVKAVLSYAALTQVGVIVVEIALGFTNLAFVHMIGHASFRLLQFLLAPNVLADMSELERLTRAPEAPGRAPRLSGWLRRHLYLPALERGFMDELTDRWLVRPFLAVVRRADRLDRFLSGSGQDEARR